VKRVLRKSGFVFRKALWLVEMSAAQLWTNRRFLALHFLVFQNRKSRREKQHLPPGSPLSVTHHFMPATHSSHPLLEVPIFQTLHTMATLCIHLFFHLFLFHWASSQDKGMGCIPKALPYMLRHYFGFTEPDFPTLILEEILTMTSSCVCVLLPSQMCFS
jgi:hypothetical protein